MNTIQDHTMRLMITSTSGAIAAMEGIRAGDRPDGYSAAIGKLMWVHDTLLDAAVGPVAVEPAREPEMAP